MTSLLAFVLAGHFIGDWIVQTDWQAANKTTSWRAMAGHMLGYHFVLGLAVLWPFAQDDTPTGGHALWWATFIAISLVTHSFIDRRWPVRWLMAHTGSKPFSETTWGVLVVDQALHLSILCLMCGVFVATL